jgi:predicted TIM-barrel fold metal-dependent hydrolase
MPGIDVLVQLGAAEWVDVTPERLVRAQQRARLDLVGVASRRALAGEVSAGNAEVKALLDQMPQAYGWVVVNPAYPERAAEELRRHVSGSRWLGAALAVEGALPGLPAVPLGSQTTVDVLNSYRRFTKPVLVPVRNGSAAAQLREVARQFPTLKFVAWGAGGDQWLEAVLTARECVNVYLEPCSGGPHRGKLEAMIAALGHNRIVFASNFPDQNPGAALGLVLEARMSEGDRAAIASSNAARLFGLRREE